MIQRIHVSRERDIRDLLDNEDQCGRSMCVIGEGGMNKDHLKIKVDQCGLIYRIWWAASVTQLTISCQPWSSWGPYWSTECLIRVIQDFDDCHCLCDGYNVGSVRMWLGAPVRMHKAASTTEGPSSVCWRLGMRTASTCKAAFTTNLCLQPITFWQFHFLFGIWSSRRFFNVALLISKVGSSDFCCNRLHVLDMAVQFSLSAVERSSSIFYFKKTSVRFHARPRVRTRNSSGSSWMQKSISSSVHTRAVQNIVHISSNPKPMYWRTWRISCVRIDYTHELAAVNKVIQL